MIITIDKYIFKATHNISALTKSIKINIDKKDTITKPIYSQIGGYEEQLSFKADILLEQKDDFKGFEALIKKGEPLKISALDLVENDYILIERLEVLADNFFKTTVEAVNYFSLSLNISGYIIKKDAENVGN